MEKEPKANKKSLSDKDLVETLMLISETSKTLALEVMLQEDEGGNKDGDKSSGT